MMKYLLSILIALLPLATYAEVITIPSGDSIQNTYYCEPGMTTECPDPVEISIFSAKHGYQHPYRAKDLKEDCTVCHSMYGEDGISTTRDIGCASVDDFFPPVGFSDIFDTNDRGEEVNTTGTKIGYLPMGTPVKCYSCHEKVKVYVNGEKEKFDFEGIREEDDDDDENGNGGEPPTDPVYQCDSKLMDEKHDFTPTPDTNCAACHGDDRVCE